MISAQGDQQTAEPPLVAARRRIRTELVNLLADSDILRNTASRELLLRLLRETLGGRLELREHAVLRPQLVELVMHCAEHPAGLRALGECLVDLEPGSAQTIGVLRLVDEWDARAFFGEHDILPLYEHLVAVYDPVELRRCLPAAVPVPPDHCANAWHVFTYLAARNSPPGGLPPSLAFLEQLVAQRIEPDAHPIRRFTARVAGSWHLEPELELARAALAGDRTGPGATASDMAYLVLQFEPDGLEEDWYVVSHWHQWASSAWRPVKGEDDLVHTDQLESTVARLVYEMEVRWAQRPWPVTLEFVLPWKLLNAPVDAWRVEAGSPGSTALGADYLLVVRSLDRLRSRQWHRRWRARWQQVTSAAEVAPFWSRPVGAEYGVRLETELKSEEGAVALVLSEPPSPGGTGQQEALAALRAGVPILVWQRKPHRGPELREKIAPLFNEGGLAQLPARARKLRQEAWRQEPQDREAHIGHHLTLLWDDPFRLPERVSFADDFEGEIQA